MRGTTGGKHVVRWCGSPLTTRTLNYCCTWLMQLLHT